MKTLDEVIDMAEKCAQYPDCEGCIYSILNEPCGGTWANDAIHYLKEYREKMNILEVRMAEYKRGFEQLGVEWSRIKDNPPLTWGELKSMEGKPVWIETDDNEKFWTIIDNFRTICNQECLCCSKGYMCRSTYTRGDWQAYRKERNE